MAVEPGSGARRASTAVASATAARACRSAAVWGVVFGLLIVEEARSYHTSFPTAADRADFAGTFGDQGGMVALLGPGRALDTVGGYVAWRLMVLLVWIGAIWGVVSATRLLRGEEDSGRWELLLAGWTSRRHATGQALAGLAAGWLVLWAVTAAFTVAAGSMADVGFGFPASLFYATTATASAAVGLALGAVASQLTSTRRQANTLAALALAAAYLARMAADTVDGLGALIWITPLGWIERLHPLTGSEPVVLAPIAALVAASAGAAVALAGRRDLGAGTLGRRARVTAGTRLVDGAHILVVQLERWVALAWIVGSGILAAVFALTARVAASGDVAATTDQDQLARMGGADAGGVRTWIGYELTYLATLLAFAAAGQIAAIRDEEASGRLDNLLAGRVGRVAWLAGRTGFAAAVVVAGGLALGLGGWIGVGTGRTDLGLGDLLTAGLNAAVPGLFLLGVGVALHAAVPRAAAPVLHAVLLWSFLVDVIGSTITTNRWLLDTSLFTHLGHVPATDVNPTAVAAVLGLGLLGLVTGLARFDRRDLSPA